MVERSRKNGQAVIAQCREIVRTHSARKFRGTLIDVQTANAIIAVADGLSADNLAKYEGFSTPHKMADIAWRVLEKSKNAGR